MADAPSAAAAKKPCCVCDGPGGLHCTKCKSRHYCGKKCQLVDWYDRGHKALCRQLAAAFQGRMLDALVPEKLKITEALAIVADVAPAAGSKAARLPAGSKAARLPAAGTTATAVVEATAVNDAAPGWRGTCAICLDLFSVCDGLQVFYACCCEKICADCSNKCTEYDERCPLCRRLPHASDAELLRRLQQHADKGNAEAQREVGYAYREGSFGLKKSEKRAFQFFQLSAAQGYAPAQTQLGVCYGVGEGVEIDYKAAALWYRRAAEQGYPDAQYNLANVFYHYQDVLSYDEAVKWYRLAAAQGNAGALFKLGMCYEAGHGVPADDDEALRCFKRAAAKGHGTAIAKLDIIKARLACSHGPR
jgi:hypothetical protein